MLLLTLIAPLCAVVLGMGKREKREGDRRYVSILSVIFMVVPDEEGIPVGASSLCSRSPFSDRERVSKAPQRPKLPPREVSISERSKIKLR